ncbi:GNAT family N-acetyltransferase [Clostridium estertheticum]|uniref:GNAT family N-acetyltransferase n=1 Tax=Clostridium estertheticum TaxID=238834 RepID=UPI001FADE0D7|nr:GNAT family N-acetyltransferase [Clostridium estertheticum]WBL47747.1 GNAT family N-acetyltransferase [Clostridium estertheticum]
MSAEKREKYFEKVLSEKLEEDVLIFKGDKPVGFMTFGKCRDGDSNSSWGEIWGIEELKSREFTKISLWVLEENSNARKSYEKIGFQHDGTVKELNIEKELKEYRYIENM